MSVFLVGGGPDGCPPGLFEHFLDEVRAVAGRTGYRPSVTVVLVDERRSVRRSFPAYERVLSSGGVGVGALRLRRGREMEPRELAGAHGIVVAGGSTPEYRTGLIGAATTFAGSVRSGLPYLGFSAGAMIAPRTALIGGHRLGGREVCPEKWSEDLAEVAVRPGLGLVDFTVDVHTAQAGTLGRTVALVESGVVDTAVGIDEGTCLTIPRPHGDPALGAVTGAGSVWVVRSGADGAAEVARRQAD